jgi:hypothetical protein
MTISAHFFSNTYDQSGDLAIAENSVLFHGEAVDERGKTAIQFEALPNLRKVLVTYDVKTMAVTVDGVSSSVEWCYQQLEPHLNGCVVLLEATTLGVAELFCVISALIKLQIKKFQVIYVEPKNYTKPKGDNTFSLSNNIMGYHPIPLSIVDLSSDDVEKGVFFLGFEAQRMERALDEHQRILNKDIKVVFGVPAYHAGWELHSIVPHLEILGGRKKFTVAYCSANEPGSAFDCLEATRNSLDPDKMMFVAPIGTKPCGVAAAVFVSLYPAQVGLIYDHPQKKENRSTGVVVWHQYVITING